MTYLALYRRFRPQRFEEIVGQEHITTTLRNQVRLGRMAHAYLFCGTRGTGKTSTAKVFARAANCLAPQDGEPCGECACCIDGEGAVDIIEIDAASNTGVDHIRDLLEKVKFAPVKGKYKVYIIDEVHMLSSSSFNALLKTLEEPPPHVIFILATTEPRKVLATILSRCQRFEFHRLPTELITKTLQSVVKSIGAQIDLRGLKAIARAAEGGMRDALSLLDQCIAFCGETADYEDVLRVLGSMDSSFLFGTAGAVLGGDCRGAVEGVASVLEKGNDLGVFCRDLIAHFRNLLLMATCKNPRELIDCSDEDYERYKAQATNKERLMRTISILVEAEYEMKRLMPRAILETALMRACTPQSETSQEAVLDRLSALEARLDSGSFAAPVQTATTAIPAAPQPVRTTTQVTAANDDIPPWEAPPGGLSPGDTSPEEAPPWEVHEGSTPFDDASQPVPQRTAPQAPAPSQPQPAPQVQQTVQVAPAVQATPAEAPEAATGATQSGSEAHGLFHRFIALLPPNLQPMVADAQPDYADSVLTIALPEQFWSFEDLLNARTASLKEQIAQLAPGLQVRFAQRQGRDVKQEIKAYFGKDVIVEEE